MFKHISELIDTYSLDLQVLIKFVRFIDSFFFNFFVEERNVSQDFLSTEQTSDVHWYFEHNVSLFLRVQMFSSTVPSIDDFFREKNNLLNENDEDNLNISRNMKSPLTNKNISSSFLYNKKDMSFNNKLNKYDHYGKEISINDNIRSYNSNERDNRVKNSFISYNPNNLFRLCQKRETHKKK